MPTSPASPDPRRRAAGPLLWLAWLLCCWLPGLAAAAIPLELNQGTVSSAPVAQWLEFHDPGMQSPTVEEILSLPDNQWHSVRQLPLQLVLGVRQTLWFRFNLRNSSANSERIVVENLNPMADAVEVYAWQGDEAIATEPIMPSVHGSHAMRMVLPPDSTTLLYLKLTGYQTINQPFVVQEAQMFKWQKFNLQLFSSLLDGMLLGLTVYTLLLGIKTGQHMYYAYALLTLTTLVATLAHQNFLPDSLVMQKGRLITNIRIIGPLLAFACLSHFIRIFLRTALYHPKIDLCLSSYILVVLLVIVAFLAGVPSLVTTPLFALATTVCLVLMLYLCLTDMNHRRVSLQLTAIALLLPCAGGLFTVLSSTSILDSTRIYVMSIQADSVGCMMLLSLAMVTRLRQLEDEHDRQTKSAAEAAIISDAHNRLLAHLNHELRTPLNGILGAAEILLHKSAPRDRHIFSMIHQTALPLKHLVDDMVNIDAISENRKSLHNSRFDLQNLLQECSDLFLPVAHAKQIRLFFRIDQDVATDVTGDPNRLRQILLNLIGNACKFTFAGEVGVHVSRRLSPRDSSLLYHFEVTDTGMGISKADEQRLFQTFESGNLSANPQGAGLGLSIVRELSELLGGSCGYSNSEHAGSRFWFTAALEPHQQISRKTHRAFENLHILIADESRLMAEQLAFQLDSTAGNILIASGREELAEVIQQQPCDIAIVHLPLLDDSNRAAIQASNAFLVSYQDQSERLQLGDTGHDDDTLVRRTSIEKFSLQIAELLIRKNHLYHRAGQAGKTQHHWRILVAEDIGTNQHIIREMLLSLSAQPVLCSNGREAFALYLEYLLDGKPFDAILMDCEMPVMDGFEATRFIRQYEQENDLAPVSIIALTAHTEEAYRHRSETAGMDLYLSKPITVESLKQCLASLENPLA